MSVRLYASTRVGRRTRIGASVGVGTILLAWPLIAAFYAMIGVLWLMWLMIVWTARGAVIITAACAAAWQQHRQHAVRQHLVSGRASSSRSR